MHFYLLLVLSAAPATCGAKTPEEALQRLEDAYRAKNVEQAVACKDFQREAAQLLKSLKSVDAGPDLVAQAAATLEQAYRAEVKKAGLPDMKGVRCEVVKKEPRGDGFLLTERCRWTDGSSGEERMLAFPSPQGWRVVLPEG